MPPLADASVTRMSNRLRADTDSRAPCTLPSARTKPLQAMMAATGAAGRQVGPNTRPTKRCGVDQQEGAGSAAEKGQQAQATAQPSLAVRRMLHGEHGLEQDCGECRRRGDERVSTRLPRLKKPSVALRSRRRRRSGLAYCSPPPPGARPRRRALRGAWHPGRCARIPVRPIRRAPAAVVTKISAIGRRDRR